MRSAITAHIATDGQVSLSVPECPGVSLSGLLPAVWADGEPLSLTAARVDGLCATYDFGDWVELRLGLTTTQTGLRIRGTLRNSGAALTLNRAQLLQTGSAAFGDPRHVRVLIQSAYSGDVVPLGFSAAAVAGGEPAGDTPAPAGLWSQCVWVAYDRGARQALLVGFVSSERFLGTIGLQAGADGGVAKWAIGMDGGDLMVLPGEEVALEEAVMLTGPDPLELLDAYAEAVVAAHPVTLPPVPPVSWCSWYPYRLGVTEDRLLENARIGAERLGALGFRIVEADLGWERDQLPNAFEENDQFPRGLRWLADELAALGLTLGVWKAPYTISAFDPLAREHPEWLVQGEDGKPLAYWTWFWEPHGDVYILDLTHPGARGWLREKIASLRRRGVGYLKSDFIGCVAGEQAKRRHDQRMVLGGGTEAARLCAQIIREELPDALLLNCGGPELPGTGHWPLLYACNDTGNIGTITWQFQQANFRALATHLFKNGRWGWIQPSCLCVGLPGTLEEARLRATVAFLAGGQIDISDALTSLPEDRWAVLRATLPPLGQSARPLDLFEPVAAPDGAEHPPGTVWHLPLQADWDDWHLLGLFNFGSAPAADPPAMLRVAVPLDRLGLRPDARLWVYEFWSGQFLGEAPVGRQNPGGYRHPGDLQDLVTGGTPGELEVAFAGPAAKLLCLRAARPHPWVVGSGFHQSCGAELTQVRWDAETNALSGILSRPAGECGALTIATTGRAVASAEVAGRPVQLAPAAEGAVRLHVIPESDNTPWRVVFGMMNL